MSSLREQLQDVYERRGCLTPALVLDEARPVDSPLHARFEWDDTVAGERWRTVQAHELIQSVRVTYQKGETLKEVRAFHAVRSPDGHVYEPVEEIVKDPFQTELLLREMEREWRQLHARWECFDEFRQMVLTDLVVAE
jgi:hypothetical protein